MPEICYLDFFTANAPAAATDAITARAIMPLSDVGCVGLSETSEADSETGSEEGSETGSSFLPEQVTIAHPRRFFAGNAEYAPAK